MDLFPPYEYLCLVGDHCPKALSTYLLLWRDYVKNNTTDDIVYNKNRLFADQLVGLKKFKNDLRELAKEGLISIDETPNTLIVSVAMWEE